MAKAALWDVTDIEERKRRQQIGLDTQVVYAVNDEYSKLVKTCFQVNTLNILPEQYGLKTKTQRNRREPTQAVEHAV